MPEARILTREGWVRGCLQVLDGRVSAIEVTGDELDPTLPVLLPGFIDLHVHGGGGSDVMDISPKTLSTIAATHARHGTTSMLATTMTAPRHEIDAALAQIDAHVKAPRPAGTARLLGVHLEGPYINPGKLGSQPNFAVPALLEELRRQCQAAPIKVLTLAPEIVGHEEAISFLRDLGVRVQIGHTLGSYEDGVAALRHGASGFTHLYNAMSPLHHREPGIVGAALAHATYSELIPDLLHVHPGAMRVALRSIPNLYCVTDATAASGMPDGDYHLGRQKVTHCLGGVRLADGTLAGSALTMDRALRNLVQIGLSLEEASDRVSRHAADYVGLDDRGRLGVGTWADAVLMSPDLQLLQVYVEGASLELPHV